MADSKVEGLDRRKMRLAWSERLGDRAPIAYLIVAGVVSIAIAIIAGLIASDRVGVHIAIDDVEAAGDWIANTVEPNLSEALITGDPDAVNEFDSLIRDQVLSKSAVRVKLRTADGRIVYSDGPGLTGEIFRLSDDEVAALQTDKPLAVVADPGDPANQSEADLGPLLQVYSPVRATNGERLLFETYFPYDMVTEHSRHVWSALLPIILSAVLVLGIIHVPLAIHMSGYMVRNQRQRESLLRSALETSNLERRRVAADLHDGVIQDLTATSFRLAAAEELFRNGDETEALETVHGSADSIRTSIADVRSLVLDVNPQNVREIGLESAIAGLLDSASEAGLATSFATADMPNLAAEMELLAFRTVRESVRNTMKHAEARTLHIEISNGVAPFIVEITDDGNGFSVEADAEDGHVGLQLLSELAADLNARLTVFSDPGQGTSVRLEADV